MSTAKQLNCQLFEPYIKPLVDENLNNHSMSEFKTYFKPDRNKEGSNERNGGRHIGNIEGAIAVVLNPLMLRIDGGVRKGRR